MENLTTDEIIERLEADWPRWQVWVANRVVGGLLWCARRRDDPGSPDELAELLEEMAVR